MAGLANRLWNDLSGGAPDNDLSGAGTPNFLQGYQAILGANLIALWDSQLGIGFGTPGVDVDTWTDQVGGLVVQAASPTNRPLYAPDGTAFGGKNVVQCAAVGSLGLRGTAAAPLVLQGTHPWYYTVGRVRAFAAGPFSMVGIGKVGLANNRFYYSNGPNVIAAEQQGLAVVSYTTGVDTARHSYAAGTDGVNGFISQDGAASASVASALGVSSDCDKVTIGCASAENQFGNYTCALYLICLAKPAPAQIVALDALSLVEFPA